MFFFFVGGLSQKVSQVVEKDAGRCIACGSITDLVKYDKVLKVFFVPVWNWPGKEPLMHCRNCDLFFPPSMSQGEMNRHAVTDVLRCQYCDKEIDAHFRFCPFCGSAI